MKTRPELQGVHGSIPCNLRGFVLGRGEKEQSTSINVTGSMAGTPLIHSQRCITLTTEMWTSKTGAAVTWEVVVVVVAESVSVSARGTAQSPHPSDAVERSMQPWPHPTPTPHSSAHSHSETPYSHSPGASHTVQQHSRVRSVSLIPHPSVGVVRQ